MHTHAQAHTHFLSGSLIFFPHLYNFISHCEEAGDTAWPRYHHNYMMQLYCGVGYDSGLVRLIKARCEITSGMQRGGGGGVIHQPSDGYISSWWSHWFCIYRRGRRTLTSHPEIRQQTFDLRGRASLSGDRRTWHGDHGRHSAAHSWINTNYSTRQRLFLSITSPRVWCYSLCRYYSTPTRGAGWFRTPMGPLFTVHSASACVFTACGCGCVGTTCWSPSLQWPWHLSAPDSENECGTGTHT